MQKGRPTERTLQRKKKKERKEFLHLKAYRDEKFLKSKKNVDCII